MERTLDYHDHEHGHSHGLIDPSIKRSREGLRAVGLSLAVLGLTALAQVAIYVASGSVALLADLIHNFGDAATAIQRELRRRSEREHKSIGELASQLLARGLHEEPEPQPGPFAWVSRDLGEPAVDLEDKEALASLLER